ncbi:MAG: hypothetical protein ACSHWS_13880 [Sulfitobacter sp.]
MNTVAELTALLKITQAKYDQQQQSFQKLVAEENRLRRELARLDTAVKRSQSEPEGETEMRAIGADIIWQGWVAQSRTQLNLKLAQVLALKLHNLVQVKQAYGKVLVIQELQEKATVRAAAKRTNAALALATDQMLY